MKKTITSKAGFITILIIISAVVICCKKKDADTSKTTTTTPTPTATYYIQAKINGTMVDAEYCTPNSDVVSNAYDVSDMRFQIERYMSASTSQGYSINVSNIDLDHITYPRTLTFSNYYALPVLDVCYNNGNSGSSGNFVVNNLDSTLFSLTLGSFTGDVLSGTFSGKLRWGNGYDSTLTFTDGEFKAKLSRY